MMNYRYGIYFLFLFLLVFFFAALPVARAAEDAIHVVAKGETVYSISRFYRISTDELMKYNGITDASKLQVGRRLRIPQTAAALPGTAASPITSGGTAGTQGAPAGNAVKAGASAYASYKVEKNDTLYSIARTHGTSFQNLRDINGFSADYVIKAGETIKVPAKAGAGTIVVTPPPGGTANTAQPDTGKEVRQTSATRIDSSIRWPVTPKEIAYMTGKLYGVVLVGDRGESVKSLTSGMVISAGPYRGFGRVAIVEVAGGYLYVYGGCENLAVKEGDRIGSGMELGKLGIDAVSGKPQLFFMVYKSNTPIDPAKAPRA